MRFCAIVVMLFLFSTNSAGKGYFKINSKVGQVTIKINGKAYEIDSNYTRIQTRFPNFDTIILIHDLKVVCNFKPDSLYTVTLACCATLDIVASYKLNNDSLDYWGENEITHKIQEALMDRAFITFKIKNGTVNDSVYAWNADYACFPSLQLINEKGCAYGVPSKCFFWTNINWFEFFKPTKSYSKDIGPCGEIEDAFPEEGTTLAHVVVRLFDTDRYIVTYDLKTKRIEVNYE
ncbi:MAG: hypothetical protein ACHQF2_09000 [Flavobacteriales bacterium]